MYIYEELKPFLLQITRLVGNGYKYLEVSYIPEKKLSKKEKIANKLDKKYNLNLSVGERQYRRRKKQANFLGLMYQNCVILLKTEGETDIDTRNFKSVLKYKIEINLDYIKLVFYVDEREKLTYRLNRTQIRDIKAKISLYLKNRQQYKFAKEITKLYNLHKVVSYRGFMLQVKELLKFIKQEQKTYKTKFNVPTFFKNNKGY